MNYCEKHKQPHMTELCPICVGERLIDFTHPNVVETHKKVVEELRNDKLKE